MQINSLSVPSGSSYYHTYPFHIFLESLIDYFTKLPSTKTIIVDRHDSYKYDGDLYGYLQDIKNIGQKYHWFIAKLNGYSSSDSFRFTDDGQTAIILLIPDLQEIDILSNVYITQNQTIA